MTNYFYNSLFKFMMSEYEWSASSAFRKLGSGLWLTVDGPGGLSLSKQITDDCNREKDAYRNCKNCGRHYNYHRNGRCPS